MDPTAPNIIVTEPVYAVSEDGRTYLAAAVGDSLSAADAAKLEIDASGKSTNGVTPATSLMGLTDEVVEPGAAGSNEGEPDPLNPDAPVVTAPAGYAELNSKEAQKAVAGYDAEQLDAVEAYETANANRSGVHSAITKRRDALKAAT